VKLKKDNIAERTIKNAENQHDRMKGRGGRGKGDARERSTESKHLFSPHPISSPHNSKPRNTQQPQSHDLNGIPTQQAKEEHYESTTIL